MTEDGSLRFVGTATTLLRYGGFTLLTDPNFLHRGERAYLGYGLSARRLTEPALGPEQLPPLDAVLLSHLHGDHWDRRARRGLDRSLPILTTPHASRRLQGWHGFRRALGLRTWESHTLLSPAGRGTLTVTAMPGRHGPGPAQLLLPPVMGSMLEFAPTDGTPPLRVYVSGDTLDIAELAEIPARYPEIDLAVLHLGGTRLPGGLVVTLDGRSGASVVERVGPRQVVPVHYDDYRVFVSPLSDFCAEMERRGLAARVRHVPRGESLSLLRA